MKFSGANQQQGLAIVEELANLCGLTIEPTHRHYAKDTTRIAYYDPAQQIVIIERISPDITQKQIDELMETGELK